MAGSNRAARKRRKPSPTEQARRVAWGKTTGGAYRADKLAGRWKEKE